MRIKSPLIDQCGICLQGLSFVTLPAVVLDSSQFLAKEIQPLHVERRALSDFPPSRSSQTCPGVFVNFCSCAFPKGNGRVYSTLPPGFSKPPRMLRLASVSPPTLGSGQDASKAPLSRNYSLRTAYHASKWILQINISGTNTFSRERKISPKFSCIKFFQSGMSRPKSRDIPATPSLKQQKRANCIKFLSGISRRLSP